MIKSTIKYFILSFGLFFLVPLVSITKAESFYTSTYDIVYSINSDLSVQTKLVINLTNLRSDIYVTKFSLFIPLQSDISNISASSPSGTVLINTEKQDRGTKVEFIFENPINGKNASNLLEVSFLESKIVRKEGNIVEIVLPTYGSVDTPTTVTLQTNNVISGPLAIAKPNPTKNDIDSLTWENTTNPIISLIFGTEQYYASHLTYTLENTKPVPVQQEIAFPPETLFQSVQIKKINPVAQQYYIDYDGNYIGRYTLKPLEKKQITFDGFITVYVQPNEDILPFIRTQYENQKQYLLTQNKYWSINSEELLTKIKDLSTPALIFNFVVDTLDYSYDSVTSTKKRDGAEGAYNNPTFAVCTEYTDLFIAIAREQGIPSREIQGYAYSEDPHFRPVSLLTDILHAWPEYYDKGSQQWVQIDPTWQDTSGINYLDGFDLSHITFSIHGKDPIYPLPAGMYKTKKRQDIRITAIKKVPQKNIRSHVSITTKFDNNKKLIMHINVLNNGSIFMKNASLNIQSEDGVFSIPSFSIPLLAPGQKQTFQTTFTPHQLINKKVLMNVTINDYFDNNFTIELPQNFEFIKRTLKIPLIISIGVILLLFVVKKIMR